MKRCRKYLLTYHGGGEMPTVQSEIDAIMKAWGDWFQGMGAAGEGPPATRSANPQPSRRTGIENNGGPNPVSGYSIIEAANQDEANKHAQGCPMLAHDGSVEVTEIIELEM